MLIVTTYIEIKLKFVNILFYFRIYCLVSIVVQSIICLYLIDVLSL